MSLLDDLNDSQRAAVEYINGPSLVIAGAGSGKTRVLTYKVAYLLELGISAGRILTLTFTNKAAREMRERIYRLVPVEKARYLWMGTFHSMCSKILRQEADKLGYTRDFTIYDTSDSTALVKRIIKELQLDDKVYKPNVVHARIGDAKNALLSPEAYAADAGRAKRDRTDSLYNLAEIYRLYQSRLHAANAMDFDDLLMQTCVLFRRYPEVLRYYQGVFEYILVDEYQDTNYPQYLIVKMLAEPENNVCVVGDDAQAIYSFRGADIRNILSFRDGYPNAQLFKLERNYRSTQTIVNAANSLIHHNSNQIYKQVYSDKSVGDPIRLNAYMSDRDEASGIALSIRRIHDYGGTAVLYRTNAQSRVFENELRKMGIPYRIYGGMSFYERKEIKDAIAYFRLAVNPKDNEALSRVINFPARGIGDTTLRKVSEQAIAMKVSMMEVVAHPMEAGLPVTAATARKLTDFALLVQRFAQALDTLDAYDFAETVLRESGVMTAALMDMTPEGKERKENLNELLAAVHDFVDQRTAEDISFTPIQDFLAEVSLLTDQDEHLGDSTPRVTLMTVHAAKGLEFPTVFIAGLEENLFPSQYCTSPAELEEERRLLYVAITRAMEHCALSFARQRFRNGSVDFSSPSRFLKDIDRRYINYQSSAPTPGPSHPTFYPRPSTLDFRPSTYDSRLSTLKQTSPHAPFQSGDRVRHNKFGEGVVLRVYNENDNDKIEIRFSSCGTKTLLLTYAKLEKL